MSGSLVQRFAAVAFLVQATLAALHHVNKVGQRLLLVHRDVPEVTTHRLQEEEGQEFRRKTQCAYLIQICIAFGN